MVPQTTSICLTTSETVSWGRRPISRQHCAQDFRTASISRKSDTVSVSHAFQGLNHVKQGFRRGSGYRMPGNVEETASQCCTHWNPEASFGSKACGFAQFVALIRPVPCADFARCVDNRGPRVHRLHLPKAPRQLRRPSTMRVVSNCSAAMARTNGRSMAWTWSIASMKSSRATASASHSTQDAPGGSRSTTTPVSPVRTNEAPVRTPTVGQPASRISCRASGPWSSSARYAHARERRAASKSCSR